MTLHWARVRSALPTVILSLSLIGNVILGLLAVRFHRASASVTIQTMLPKPGATVNSVVLLTPLGASVRYPFANGARPTLVYVFSPACGWCAKNLPNIVRLDSAVHNRYNVIWISLTSDGISDYLRKIPPTYSDVYVTDKPSISDEIPLAATPETLVFNKRGTLLKVFAGAYTDDTKKAIALYFDLGDPNKFFGN